MALSAAKFSRSSRKRRGGAAVWLLKDEFTTDAGAPLTSPRNAEPGPGTLTLTQVDGQFSIVSGKLNFPAQATPVFGDLGYYATTALARAIGRAMIQDLVFTTLTNAGHLIGWGAGTGITSAPGDFDNGNLNIASTGLSWWNGTANLVLLPSVVNGNYAIAIVLRSVGNFTFWKTGGVWTLVWVDLSQNGASIRPKFANETNVGTSEYLRVRDLGGAFSSDNGITENNITTFTQSVGSELVVNGNFAAWTGDNPNGWSAPSGEPANGEVTERGSGATHAGAGTGAANFFRSAAGTLWITQSILTSGSWYELTYDLTAFASGNIAMFLNNKAIGGVNSAVTSKAGIARADGATFFATANTNPTDITIDNVSLKLLTLNAQVTMDANSIIDFAFTLPGSPVAGQRVELRYRIQDDQNYWVSYVQRNDGNTAWDFLLDSVVAGTASNRLNVNGVGSIDTLRVICDGNLHDAYTKTGSTWTKRGVQVNNASFNTATGLNTVYATGTTPGSLISYRRSSPAYNVLDAG